MLKWSHCPVSADAALEQPPGRGTALWHSAGPGPPSGRELWALLLLQWWGFTEQTCTSFVYCVLSGLFTVQLQWRCIMLIYKHSHRNKKPLIPFTSSWVIPTKSVWVFLGWSTKSDRVQEEFRQSPRAQGVTLGDGSWRARRWIWWSLCVPPPSAYSVNLSICSWD